MEDLQGKKIVLGVPVSGTNYNSRKILNILNIEADIVELSLVFALRILKKQWRLVAMMIAAAFSFFCLYMDGFSVISIETTGDFIFGLHMCIMPFILAVDTRRFLLQCLK